MRNRVVWKSPGPRNHTKDPLRIPSASLGWEYLRFAVRTPLLNQACVLSRRLHSTFSSREDSYPSSSATKPKAVLELQRFRCHLSRTIARFPYPSFIPTVPKPVRIEEFPQR